MFDSALIDIAIGLSMVFLLFSLLVSAASEIVASVLGMRARNLWEGVAKLLQSEQMRNDLYDHPLIRGLSASLPLGATVNKKGSNGPSYIPSKTFALALLETFREPRKVAADLTAKADALASKFTEDPKAALADMKAALVRAAGADAVSPEMKATLETLQRTWFDPLPVDEVKRLTASVTDAVSGAQDPRIKEDLDQWTTLARSATGIQARRALEQIALRIADGGGDHRTRELLLSAASSIGSGSPEALSTAVRTAAEQFLQTKMAQAGSGLPKALGSLLDDAAGNVDRFRENIEVWFNDAMDRVSGLYKRRSMVVQFTIAIILAAMMNVDSLLIARALWREPTLRKALADQGAAMVETPPPSLIRPRSVPDTTQGAVTVSARLSAPTVAAGKTQLAHVVVSTATPDAPVDRTVTVKVESAHLTVRETVDGPDKTELSLAIPAASDRKEIPFYIAATSALEAESLERLSVAVTGGPSTAVELVATPSADRRYELVKQQIESLGLPIGWSCTPGATVQQYWCDKEGGALGSQTPLKSAWSFLAVLFGWLLTASAASLGAPFWFDLLKRVVSVRSSGKAPEERPLAPKEVSQPREPGQRPIDADILRALAKR